MTVVEDPNFELNKAHEALQAELQDLRSSNAAFQADHERVCANLNAARTDLNNAQFENTQLQNRLHRVEHELEDLKIKKSQSSARTEDLEQQIVSLKISLTASKTSVDELQQQVMELEATKSKNASLSGEIQSMSEAKSGHLTEITELRRKVATLQNDLAAKQKDLEQAEEFEIKLEEEIQYSKDLDNSYTQINEGYAKLYESYCNNLEELEEMRQKNHDFRDELKACSLYIRSQAERASASSSSSSYAKPPRHIDILDQEVHLEAQELRQKNLQLRAREKTLFQANYERTEEVCRVRERNAMLEREVDNLELQLKRTQDEKASLSPSFGSMRQKELVRAVLCRVCVILFDSRLNLLLTLYCMASYCDFLCDLIYSSCE